MSLRNRYLQLLTSLLPSGAFGLSVALASGAARATPVEQRAASPSTFSERSCRRSGMALIRLGWK